MLIDSTLLDNLTEEARRSPRLRMNYDLRNSSGDGSQRMLNAMEPGTLIPVHRHTKSSETVVVIRGAIRQNFYDDGGNVTESVIYRAGRRSRSALSLSMPGTILNHWRQGPSYSKPRTERTNRLEMRTY